MKRENELLHIGFGTGEMQEESCLESCHRAHSLQAAKPYNPCRTVPQKRWLPGNNMSLWLRFEKDACKIIEMTAKGEVNHWLEVTTFIIVHYASERFGHIERDNVQLTYTMNCQTTKIHQLRKEL